MTWTLDADGTLTISGTGDMYFYNGIDDVSPWPWWEQCDKITAGVIGSGVTSSSDFTFTLSPLGDKSVPENTAAWQAVYNESGQLVSIKRLPSAKDGSSGISFKGSASAAGGQKCSMFVLDGNSAPMIEKYILS